MILANSKNTNYMISQNNVPLIRRYMLNSISLDLLIGNNKQSLAAQEVIDNVNKYITSFGYCLSEYRNNNLNIEMIFNEIRKNHEFCGALINGILEKGTIDHSLSTQNSILKLI